MEDKCVMWRGLTMALLKKVGRQMCYVARCNHDSVEEGGKTNMLCGAR